MAEGKRVQFVGRVIAIVSVAVAVAGCFSLAKVFTAPVETDIGHPAIRASALGPVVLWCLGWPVAFANAARASVARIPWAAGSVLLLLHIAVAFHLGHGWSHAAAWEHTKQVGGYGDGIFVNYLFALVWLADAVWACAAPDSYRARPRWLNGTVHGFLAFVVFNAAVVFGSSNARVAFAVGLAFALPAYRCRNPNSD